jgi:beta-lactamase class A
MVARSTREPRRSDAGAESRVGLPSSNGRVYNHRVIGAMALAVGVFVSGRFAPSTDPALQATLSRLARQTPGVAGISVMHIESGASAAVNGDQRFPMMSVYKLPIAIHALREADAKRLNLDESVTLAAADRRPGFSPMAEKIAAGGPLTVTIRDLLFEIVTRSDNTASDWLLRRVGGPRAVAATLRALAVDGVDVSRYELEFAGDYYGLCCVADLKPFSLEGFADAVAHVPEAAPIRAMRQHHRVTPRCSRGCTEASY